MLTNRYLLPPYFKVIGWFFSVTSALTLSTYLLRGRVLEILNRDSITATNTAAFLMLGLVYIAFSKEKMEDEYIAKVRGDSLIWAVIANTTVMGLILFLSAWIKWFPYVTVFRGWFPYVLFSNFYTVLILYLIKFNLALSHLKKWTKNEEQFKS